MHENNNQLVDYDAVLDAKFGKIGTPHASKQKRKPMLSIPGKL